MARAISSLPVPVSPRMSTVLSVRATCWIASRTAFIAGLVAESVLKATAWPPTPAKVLAAMNNVKVDLKGLRGGPLEWTADNHFRTTQYYRVWHWDPAKQAIIQIQDWQAIPVKR